MFRAIYTFFDKFEDRVRSVMSRSPILYALLGGVFVVLFWRGVWHTADILQAKGGILFWIFYEPVNMIIAIIGLLATGLFVSIFIGDAILISGLNKEKKIYEKTETEVKKESGRIGEMELLATEIRKEVSEIKEDIEHIQVELDEVKISSDIASNNKE